jgi:hypothetical protein
MSNNNINTNQDFYNQEEFYNRSNLNSTSIPINAVPAYPIHNSNHSSGPSSEPQLNNNELQYYDNNYLVNNYSYFVNNYINTVNNSINYLNNSNNSIREMINELNNMHNNLDYYYYNLYRNNLRIQNEYNNRQYYNNISENQQVQQHQQDQQHQQHQQDQQNQEETNESIDSEEHEDSSYEVNHLNLEFNHEHYQELSNTNIYNCINSNINNITFSSIGNPVNNTCAISQDEFEENEEVSVFNYCGHIFKKEPLNTWLMTHQTCPNCRFNILTNSNLIKYSNSDETFKYFLTLNQFRELLANNIINNLLNRSSRDTSNNSTSFIIRR